MSDAKPKDLWALEGISQLVFNKDFTQCAVSKKDNKVYIYSCVPLEDPEKWNTTPLHVLNSHFLYVSGLDWCPETNRILTCSYDKTCYIWDYTDGKWIPNILTATANIGYLFCHWNKRGDKLVAGTSEKKLFIGYYSRQAQWWSGRNIKYHKSSVCCGRIDPSSLYVISGSTDFKVSVHSCYDPEIDDQFLPAGKDKGSIPAFGELIYEFETGTWINEVVWNESGNLAYAAGHNSNIYLIDPVAKTANPLFLNHAAVAKIIPIEDKGFYAVGFDREIYYYEKVGDKWAMAKQITENKVKKGDGAPVASLSGGGVAERLKMFGGANALKKKTSLVFTTTANDNLHKANISTISIKGKKIITTDFAGFIKFWSV
ncbi:MAG: hypothetical protein MJ252_31200 [archaeon]|nr:hypothetical protein [archaeon]